MAGTQIFSNRYFVGKQWGTIWAKERSNLPRRLTVFGVDGTKLDDFFVFNEPREYDLTGVIENTELLEYIRQEYVNSGRMGHLDWMRFVGESIQNEENSSSAIVYLLEYIQEEQWGYLTDFHKDARPTGFTVHINGQYGFQLIHVAARRGDARIIRKLIEMKADITEKTSKRTGKRTALEIANERGASQEVLELLQP